MLSGKNSKGVAILLSLLIVTTAKAIPTINSCKSSFTAQAGFPGSDAHNFAGPRISSAAELYSTYLSIIGETYLRPSPIFTDVSSSQIRSLPAIPAALSMVLTGFLCVSLVKDRKLWLAVLAGVLWLGQAGFASLPQLALHLPGKKQDKHSCLKVIYKRDFTNIHSPGPVTSTITYQKLYARTPGYLNKDTYTSQPAIIPEQCSSNPLFNCLASRAKQLICFSPAFIFAELPRGPPELSLTQT